MAFSCFTALSHPLCPRAQIPQHARGLARVFKMSLPLLAKPYFVYPMRSGESRYKNGEGQHGQGHRLFLEHGGADAVDVRSQFGIGSLGSVDPAAAGAQAGKKLAYRARSAYLGVGQSYAGNGVRIAAADADLAQPLRQLLRLAVRRPPHLPVADLKSRRIGREPVKILGVALARQPGEHVIYTEEELLLGQVHQQGNKVVTPVLDLGMVAIGQVVDADVYHRSAGHAASDFFTYEKVGIAPQGLGCIY